jgi:hypothetical protein
VPRVEKSQTDQHQPFLFVFIFPAEKEKTSGVDVAASVRFCVLLLHESEEAGVEEVVSLRW